MVNRDGAEGCFCFHSVLFCQGLGAAEIVVASRKNRIAGIAGHVLRVKELDAGGADAAQKENVVRRNCGSVAIHRPGIA